MRLPRPNILSALLVALSLTASLGAHSARASDEAIAYSCCLTFGAHTHASADLDAATTVAPQPVLASATSSFDIVINPSGTFASNTAAVAAFNRAAAQWEAFLGDPVQINISAIFDSSLPTGALGSTQSVMITRLYDPVRNAMVFDAADETDDGVVSALPTAATFTAALPAGRNFDAAGTQMRVTRANYKALGLIASDATSDGTIRFSPTFNFDFDNSNGVTPGAWDFESVAAHEIGHLLGFESEVDQLNNGFSTIARPMPIDLFRFEDGSANDPSNLAEFSIMSRSLVPGATAITDDLTYEWLMSTGANTGLFPGLDGRQASHWKADELTGTYIGILDPTVRSNTIFSITGADLRALDLIGYEVTIPEPGGLALLASGAVLLLRRRARLSEARFPARE